MIPDWSTGTRGFVGCRQVTQNLTKYSLFPKLRRQQAFDIFEDKDRWTMFGKYPKVLLIQKDAVVVRINSSIP